jgi:hypothetical protein
VRQLSGTSKLKRREVEGYSAGKEPKLSLPNSDISTEVDGAHWGFRMWVGISVAR